MENKMLLEVLLLFFTLIQGCVGYCDGSYCNDGFSVWRIWYLWVIVIIVISMCCGGCGAYRRRQLMVQQQQQRTVIVGGAPVIAVHSPPGQVNYGYNMNPAPVGPMAPMAPPSYSAAAGYPAPTSPTPTAPGGAQAAYTIQGDPNAAQNKSPLPSEPPPAYTEAVKQSS